ncbi:helix-turn-helix domain-containing protein [Stenotrophomonas maltophilia]|uniref:helix-turn-helix domain-containing protein n=1 Tax=Stenotrophomonas maltophilia TaxID=40324 RepID=UPI000DA94E5C
MSDIGTAFAAAVRKRRQARGLSQEALAEFAGINRTYMSSIERAKSVPSLETAHRIALALDMTLHDLIQECDSAISDPRASH